LSTRTTTARLPAAERRLSIEDAASRIFAERGYAGTSLEQVATAAGVTKPVIYRHFGSKKELHLALLARHRDELLSSFAGGLAGEGTLADRIAATIDIWFAYVEAHPYAWRMLFRDTTGDPEIQEFHRQMQASARAATRFLLEAEPGVRVPGHLLDALSEVVRSATVGLALWWAENPEVSREQIVALLSRTIWRGIAPTVESGE
jgi:AcrR family transcriptional regulator